MSVRALHGVKDGHYQSKGFVCLSVIRRACANNLVGAIDRLLIFTRIGVRSSKKARHMVLASMH